MATPQQGTDAWVTTAEEPEAPSMRLYGIEDWIIFVFFWALAILVFLQFFTRYVLNNSLSWTEEIAQYVLITLTFVGASLAARKRTHIVVEMLYLTLPPRVGMWLSRAVDVISIGFYGFSAWLSYKVMLIMHHQPMIIIPAPLSIVYVFVLAGFIGMTIREVIALINNFREGGDVLSRTAQEGRHQ